MAKPIIVFELKGIPSQEEREKINDMVQKLPFAKEYHTLIIFDCDKTQVKLLAKGRNTKTVTNKIAAQWQKINT